MADLDSTRRFSNRVADYTRYRPSYPTEAIDRLLAVLALGPGSRVADVGSGTGIFSRALVERGLTVYAVEPNREMRLAAESVLGTHPGFHSLDGTAEKLPLTNGAVSAVVAAQAFHWFDGPRAAAEFRRVLIPGGRVALIWNTRDTGSSAFLADYDDLLRRSAPEYERVRERYAANEGALRAFFGGHYDVFRCRHRQVFSRESLIGRALSSSYAPARGSAGHDAFVAALGALFARHQRDGELEFPYQTEVFYAEVNPS